MLVTKRIDIPLLVAQLAAASIVVPTVGLTEAVPSPETPAEIFTYDAQGMPVELPPGSDPVVQAHVAPPRVIDVAELATVDAILRTTDATAHEVFRFPCEQHRLYRAELSIFGVDAVSFASKAMTGQFTWKRVTGNAIVVGIVVLADIHDAAAASWAPNCLPSGTDIVFTVAGAAGRTIDWMLAGPVSVYAPAGLGG